MLIILLLSYFFFFFNLGRYSLKEPDEGRYAEIPREMVEQGDYLVPHFNYVRYFEKPPLLYWIVAASYKIGGVSEWSFRFPNALAGLFCVLVVFWAGRRWFSAEVGLLSAILLMSSFGYFASARIVTTDLLLASLLFAAVVSFYEFSRDRKSTYLYLFYLFLALATLAKGPIAVLLVGLTILVYLYSVKDLSFLKKLLNPWGLLLYAVIAMPWFLTMSFHEKGFFDFFFVDQHILRFITKKHDRSGPIYYFIPVIAAGMLPWSFFIPRAIITLWKSRELRLFFIWSAVVFAFFSLSGSKLPPYVLPIFPALSLILGYMFGTRFSESIHFKKEIGALVLFFAIAGFAGMLGASGMMQKVFGAETQIRSLIADMKGFTTGLMVVPAIAAVLFMWKRMRRFSSVYYILSCFSLWLVLGIMVNADVIDRVKTSKHVADLTKLEDNRAPLLVNYHSFEESIPFYTGKRLYIAGYKGELEMGAEHPDARPYFLDEDAFRTLYFSDQPVLVIVKSKRLGAFKENYGSVELLKCRDELCLVPNKAQMEKRNEGLLHTF